MTVPLVVLAIGAAVLGLVVGVPPETGLLAQWLEPVFVAARERAAGAEAGFALFGIDGALILASVTIATMVIAVAWRLFGVELPTVGLRRAPEPERVAALTQRTGLGRFLYRASLNKWWFDDLNDLLFIRIGGAVASGMKAFDERVVDGVVNEIGRLTILAGGGLRRVQTGRVQNYALGIAVGLIVMAGAYLLMASR